MSTAVRLRLALSGPKHRKIFHLVATPTHRRRDGKPIETLGVFDPQLKPGETTKTVEWSVDRIKYWLRRGAQPSLAVSKLLTMGGILTPESQYQRELELNKNSRRNTSNTAEA